MNTSNQDRRIVIDGEGTLYELPLAELERYRANSSRIAELHAALTATDTAGFAYEHEVKLGDSLWDIATQVYGDGKLWPLLWAANREAIDNPNLIFPGMRLMLPRG